MAVTPDDAIKAIRGTGGAQPGCRALHAKGTLYHGRFTASPEAAALSRAKHLDGSSVPALFRFSNGAGNPKQPDKVSGVRGLAVKLTLPDGSTTDVSTQTARLFVSSTPDGFVDLLKAMRPGPTMPLRMATYLATHPRLLGALPVLRDANRVPASYATVEFHGLHAFRWVAADGSARFVRYHLHPVAGEEFLPGRAAKGKDPDFLPRARGHHQLWRAGPARHRRGQHRKRHSESGQCTVHAVASFRVGIWLRVCGEGGNTANYSPSAQSRSRGHQTCRRVPTWLTW